MKKKSYMNKKNIIPEGFFTDLLKKLKGDSKFMKLLTQANKNRDELEQSINTAYKKMGSTKRVKLSNYTAKDFIE
jgi:uncharacterized protein YdcH (DUF465 family)